MDESTYLCIGNVAGNEGWRRGFLKEVVSKPNWKVLLPNCDELFFLE